MDLLSATASLIAIVTFAVQSLNVIGQVLHTIRDGPKRILELTSRVKRFHSILLRVAELLKQAGQVDEPTDMPAFEGMRPILYRCASNLQKIQLLLSTTNLPKNRDLKRAWAAVKDVLGSKDLDHANQTIEHDMQELHFEVSVLGRYGILTLMIE